MIHLLPKSLSPWLKQTSTLSSLISVPFYGRPHSSVQSRIIILHKTYQACNLAISESCLIYWWSRFVVVAFLAMKHWSIDQYLMCDVVRAWVMKRRWALKGHIQMTKLITGVEYLSNLLSMSIVVNMTCLSDLGPIWLQKTWILSIMIVINILDFLTYTMVRPSLRCVD